MVITTINLETDVRRQYNRRVLFCFRIKGAALLIGLWDLFIHSAALFALIFMFGRVPRIDMEMMSNDDRSYRSVTPLFASFDGSSLNNKSPLSTNLLLNRILEKRNATQSPANMKSRHIYTNLDLMTTKWMQSLSQQDKCVVFFIIFSANIFILFHLWGVLINKPSYIVPYFLTKVLNVIISIMSMLGFYAYLPDINVWLRIQPDFPFKSYLLELDSQTLQLVTFTFLLLVILAKLYIAAIVWYCYGYITALNMARTIGIITHDNPSEIIIGEMYSPPKYEEAIKSHSQHEENCAPPPYTPLLSS